MNVQRSLVRPSFVLLAVAIGCGAPERPAPAGDSTVEADTTALATGAPACEPRSSRPCRHYFRDSRGQEQCPMATQICSVDGDAWLACGEYDYDRNGDPTRR
jgi:hypothetical protein